MKYVKDFRYHVYADFFGKGMELAAWHDDRKSAEKDAAFLRKKGHEVEIRENKQ